VDLGRLPHHGWDGALRGVGDADAGPAPAGAVRDDYGLLRLRTAGALCRSESDPGHPPPPPLELPLRRR
jgi:hypothetical protein